MKLLPLKYLSLFIILLLFPEISRGQINNRLIESGEVTPDKYSGDESHEKDCLNLELKESGSRPKNQGEKVETVVITRPLSGNSKIRFINLFTLQKIVLSKENYSIIAHHYPLISKTPQISPLVNILRI